ncbi:sigma factor-like helix-turn-helix DNA-binding protein [Tindallia californiensis]|uniref:Sigma-70, region 4 n=1 Tax=Tindallia californiensis TaxID=159292 RepID=A0A1H3R114_9FIRM|nr:sigma factor-like helix-turn-helix DNA-binding protein [Tindallia californiensis]SDZ19001.1 Sigma-70, region 4 [Tindallia californiensis]
MKITKKELQEYCWLKQNIRRNEERLFELQEQARFKSREMKEDNTKCTPENGDRIGNYVSEIIIVRDIINRDLQKAYRVQAKILKAINTLPEREKLLMTLRYIDCLTWEEVAAEMGYTWQHLHRIHPKCLDVLSGRDRMRA